MGYPQGLLSSRAIIEPGKFALIPPEGLVNNVIPGFSGCYTSIVASPKYGASFVQYLVTMEHGGKNDLLFGGDGRIETFLYVLDGTLMVHADGKDITLETGGFIFTPPETGMTFENNSGKQTKFILYKQVHIALEGKKPWLVTGNVADLETTNYDNMANVYMTNFLPTDLNFDMNFHILSFEPGGCHPFIETHVQEHGAYLMSGEGVYNLNNNWIPVQKGDFIWFGPFSLQAVYASGRERLTYIYSKDCNRDVTL